MFNDEQIKFMKSLGLKLNFDELSDEDLIKIEDTIAEVLQKKGFNDAYNATPIGLMCESILDNLS